MNGKWCLKAFECKICGFFGEIMGGFHGFLVVLSHIGDAEVAALLAEAGEIPVISQVKFQAIDAVETDGVLFALGGFNAEAIAIGPVSGDKFALLKLFKRLGGSG